MKAGPATYCRFGLTFFLIVCVACSEGERSIEYDGFVLTEEPSEAPRVFPPGFVYPEARPAMSGVYTRSPYASTREGVLVYESDDPLPQIQAFYLRKFEALGWQIIQSQENTGEVFLLAENLSRRLFTVILRDGMPATVNGNESGHQTEDSGEPSSAAPQPDAPLKPLSPSEAGANIPGDDGSSATAGGDAQKRVVQIKLYIKQAGLR